MKEKHLTTFELDAYIVGELNRDSRAEAKQHLANCSTCRARVAREQRFERVLSGMPRLKSPADLSARIMEAVEWRIGEEKSRRDRVPWVALATLISLTMTAWFGVQLYLALDDNGALDLFSLYASRPELVSSYFVDAVLALIETLPVSEIFLTGFAVLVVVILAQQWADTLQPRVIFHGKTK